jgi:hypothetical protein
MENGILLNGKVCPETETRRCDDGDAYPRLLGRPGEGGMKAGDARGFGNKGVYFSFP